jgi:putative pimeloyl-BioC--CoA transferase BioH
MSVYIEQLGRGPDLVLLHGWGLNGAVWQEVIPYLQQHYRLHLVDLPGFGHSRDMVMSKYDLSALSETVLAELPPQFHVLGWSMGGLLALRMALDHPARIQRLILTASSPCFLQQTDWPGIRAEVLAGFNALLQQDTRKTIERFLAIQSMGSATAKEDIRRLKQGLQLRPDAMPIALSAGLDLLQSVDLRAQLSKLKCPVLGIYGRLDSLVPVAAVTQIESLIPDCCSVVFAQAAHTPFISHAQQFALELQTFLG